MMNTENCKCATCLWADKCDSRAPDTVECDYYDPSDDAETDALAEEDYRKNLTERQSTYMEIVYEQNE